MKTLLIINPYSRAGKSACLAKKCIKYLMSRAFQFDYVEIKSFDDAYNLSLQANKDGIENIIAVGGDGTINQVINGFYDDNGNKISDSRFGVIYTGTSPDFCKSYNIPINIYQASDLIINPGIRYIPIGMIKFNNTLTNASISSQHDLIGTKYFACCANIGLGAKLAQSANSGIRKYLGDFLGTFLCLLKIISTFNSTDYQVHINGKSAELKNMYNVSVGLTTYIASGIKVYRDKKNPDDEFYLLKTSNINMKNIIGLLFKVYSGKEFKNTPYISIEYAKNISFSPNRDNPQVEFDGDPAGFLPVTIEIAKDRLPLLISGS